MEAAAFVDGNGTQVLLQWHSRIAAMALKCAGTCSASLPLMHAQGTTPLAETSKSADFLCKLMFHQTL